MSVSAQQSDDKKTVVVRIVNAVAGAQDTLINLRGFTAATATAVVMSSSDLDGENTAANVDNIAPKVKTGLVVSGGSVTLSLDGLSYTVVTVHA
jgi:alpha-L-arabinofuranosidase